MDNILFELLARAALKIFAHFAISEPIKEMGFAAWLGCVSVVVLIVAAWIVVSRRSRTPALAKRKRKSKKK